MSVKHAAYLTPRDEYSCYEGYTERPSSTDHSIDHQFHWIFFSLYETSVKMPVQKLLLKTEKEGDQVARLHNSPSNPL